MNNRATSVLKLGLILFFLALASGCEDSERILFEGPYHVRFTELSGAVVENNNYPTTLNRNESIEVKVHIASPLLNADTEVSFDLFGDAVENVDYRLLNATDKKIVIPAGESEAIIQFVPINNRKTDGDREIVFTINGVNNGLEIGRSGGGIIGRSTSYTISDDDCLVDLRLLEGTWAVTETIGVEEGAFEEEYDITIAPNFDSNNQLIIKGLGGVADAEVFANLDLCQRGFSLPEQIVQGLSLNTSTRTEASGSFDEEGGRIVFTYTMDVRGNVTRNFTASKKN
ncbi:hypothetical protein R9C00_05040 [Flammeovirgaceae bacterium SG7u.111]|nr:hypothetical protein [Flammeovirgaceae bacterium SG7u.132]WPO36810.1 hypothetical protein R9C00_05040 [Flammeovirgaceae bacterium SG7u.111]